MFVYLVFCQQAYENTLIGVFSSYEKARAFELDYIAKWEISGEHEWTVINKVEVDNVDYAYGDIGEEV